MPAAAAAAAVTFVWTFGEWGFRGFFEKKREASVTMCLLVEILKQCWQHSRTKMVEFQMFNEYERAFWKFINN